MELFQRGGVNSRCQVNTSDQRVEQSKYGEINTTQCLVLKWKENCLGELFKGASASSKQKVQRSNKHIAYLYRCVLACVCVRSHLLAWPSIEFNPQCRIRANKSICTISLPLCVPQLRNGIESVKKKRSLTKIEYWFRNAVSLLRLHFVQLLCVCVSVTVGVFTCVLLECCCCGCQINKQKLKTRK